MARRPHPCFISSGQIIGSGSQTWTGIWCKIEALLVPSLPSLPSYVLSTEHDPYRRS